MSIIAANLDYLKHYLLIFLHYFVHAVYKLLRMLKNLKIVKACRNRSMSWSGLIVFNKSCVHTHTKDRGYAIKHRDQINGDWLSLVHWCAKICTPI